MEFSRRKFMVGGAALGVAPGMLYGLAVEDRTGPTDKAGDPREDIKEKVSPVEDLMREHGVLRRILLIYGESLRRLHTHRDTRQKTLCDAATIVRSFVEDYHEKLEEEYLFPRFKKAGQLATLVVVLADQHRAGRRLTDIVLRLSAVPSLDNQQDRKSLGDAVRSFLRIYRPHSAREDTVLFPALRGIVSVSEYDDLGARFEQKERQLFGEGGFEKVVDQVATLEKSLGIYDLAQFTPRE